MKDVIKHKVQPKEPKKIEFELKEEESDSTTEEDSKVRHKRHKRQFGPLLNTAMSWMKDFFSKHGECMPNRETINIPDNFSRREIYNLYKEYAESVEGQGQFITYQYFVKIWKKEFNNVRIPKKTRMGICSTCASLK